MSERLRHTCLVPFCKRSTTKWPEAREWVCHRHWQAIPLRQRQRWRRVLLAHRAAREAGNDARAEHIRAKAAPIWARLKRWAIERAGGIA